MATIQRNRYDTEGSPVKQETWPESKWEFNSVGAKGGTNNIEFTSICSLVLFPKPLIDFGDNGQWFPLEKTGSSVDMASLQRIGDLYAARVRLIQDENKRINDTYYRSLYSYVLGNCKDGTSGLYAFGYVNSKNIVVVSGLVPLNEVKMEKVEGINPPSVLWAGVCTPPTNPEKGTTKTENNPNNEHGTYTGTGFFVSREGYILTNSHVASGCATLTARTSDRVTVPARFVSNDKLNDLALLQVDKPPQQFVSFRQQPVVIGEQVFAFGYPLSGLLSSGGNGTTGIVSATTGIDDDTSKIQLTVPVQHGNSGGALFDRFGAVTGVIVAKLNTLENGDIPQNVNFAIKHTTAMAFLDSLGVKYQLSKQASAIEPTAIFSKAKSLSVYIECTR
jgi:S1-C subfamily serine protease